MSDVRLVCAECASVFHAKPGKAARAKYCGQRCARETKLYQRFALRHGTARERDAARARRYKAS